MSARNSTGAHYVLSKTTAKSQPPNPIALPSNPTLLPPAVCPALLPPPPPRPSGSLVESFEDVLADVAHSHLAILTHLGYLLGQVLAALLEGGGGRRERGVGGGRERVEKDGGGVRDVPLRSATCVV
jgi:hypothetical protein